MAADTPTKRVAAIDFGLGGLTLPIPDGMISAADRAHLLGLYLASQYIPKEYHLDHQQNWRLQQQAVKYPFADYVTLMGSGGDVVPSEVFVDAVFHPIGGDGQLFLSSVVVGSAEITFNFSDQTTTDLCYATYAKSTLPAELQVLDAYERPAGRIVVNTDVIGELTSWSLGTHSFTSAATAIDPSAQLPMPEVGLRGFVLPDGEVFSGPVTFVGEDGVYFRTREESLGDNTYTVLVVDVTGDPLFLRKGCEEESAAGANALNDGPFLTTINGRASDDSGNFMIYPGNDIVDDTVVRIRPNGNGLIVELVGSKVSG